MAAFAYHVLWPIMAITGIVGLVYGLLDNALDRMLGG